MTNFKGTSLHINYSSQSGEGSGRSSELKSGKKGLSREREDAMPSGKNNRKRTRKKRFLGKDRGTV